MRQPVDRDARNMRFRAYIVAVGVLILMIVALLVVLFQGPSATIPSADHPISKNKSAGPSETGRQETQSPASIAEKTEPMSAQADETKAISPSRLELTYENAQQDPPKSSNAKFLEKYPEAESYLQSLTNTFDALREKESSGLKAVIETRYKAESANEFLYTNKITAYVYGQKYRYDIERDGETLIKINDGVMEYVMRKPSGESTVAPSETKHNQLVLAPWYSNSIEWVTFEIAKIVDESSVEVKDVPIMRGKMPEGKLEVRFDAEMTSKIAQIVIIAGGASRQEQLIQDFIQVDGIWVGKKVKSYQQT